MAWWNTNYPFKRQLTIENTVLQGHPILVVIDYTALSISNKMRSDFADLEVIWTTNDATPVMTAIPRDTFVVGDDLYVRFAAQANTQANDTSYALYFGNKALVGAPVRTGASPNLYPITVTPTTGLGLSFARPNEDWSNGTSVANGARATFSFTGLDARLTMEKGPNKGIAVFRLDNEPEFTIDMFNPTATNVIVWTSEGLTADKHNLRIRTDGNKAPASTDSQIKIVNGQYSNYVAAEVSSEEMYSGLSSIRIMVGI